MVAVREDHRGRGLARRLYDHFEAVARSRGAVALRAITTPGNLGSVAFHRALGFEPEAGEGSAGDVPAVKHYAGPGEHRVVLVKPIEAR